MWELGQRPVALVLGMWPLWAIWAAIGAVGAAPAGSSAEAQLRAAAQWNFAGPGSYVNEGDPLNISSAGAINTVVSTGTAWLVGSVNGGVWRTERLGTTVSWTPVLDNQPVTCQSITTLAVDPSDSNVVYAGCGGATSSEQGGDWNVLNTGDWGGVMVSRDSGLTWRMMSFPANYFVTSILPLAKATVLVAARSHFLNASQGGIWRQEGGEQAPWVQVTDQPVFNLAWVPQGAGRVVAVRALEARTAISSLDNGRTFSDWSDGVVWTGARLPFYPCITVGKQAIFLGALTLDTSSPSNTFSDVFWRPLDDDNTTGWQLVENQPQSLDQDAMPKDRMALLADPNQANLLYVAGNAGSVSYRVDWRRGEWTLMVNNDTSDNSAPHCDCRNYAWDYATQSLLLVSDGGVFWRHGPAAPGGTWHSLNGNIGEMEFLSVAWDAELDRWVAGAQDNSVQVSAPGATPGALAVGYVDGDGTLTAVDNSQSPPRLFGARQFLGVGDVDRTAPAGDDDDSNDDDAGLVFVQGHAPVLRVELPLDSFGFTPQSFPYFVQPFVLNSVRPTDFTFWAHGTNLKVAGWYVLEIPPGLNHSSQLQPPTLLAATGGNVLTFVAGGAIDGKAEPGVLVGVNSTHLYFRAHATAAVTVSALPVRFAEPLDFKFDAHGQPILGPVSHGKTMSLAISPTDARVVAVTGWGSIATNGGNENVVLTQDAGSSWTDITGNLVAATGTVGKARPAGLLFLGKSLLVGTTHGVFATSLVDGTHTWNRVGGASFPTVLTSNLHYSPEDDVLLAATMGRGIFMLHNASSFFA